MEWQKTQESTKKKKNEGKERKKYRIPFYTIVKNDEILRSFYCNRNNEVFDMLRLGHHRYIPES